MYKYGMLYRGFSPMQGLIERQDDTSGKYFDILVYDRKLTDAEVKNYELEEITMADVKKYTITYGINGEVKQQPRKAETAEKAVRQFAKQYGWIVTAAVKNQANAIGKESCIAYCVRANNEGTDVCADEEA